MCVNDNSARDTDCAFALVITNGYSLCSESVGYTIYIIFMHYFEITYTHTFKHETEKKHYGPSDIGVTRILTGL